jgi:polysaccharide deacetylase family protein (PEP-CTERM system associated)
VTQAHHDSTPGTFSHVAPEGDAGPLRCISIDVEEYFHIEAAHGTIARERWADWPSRVERNVDLLLSLFYRHGRAATFFILGDVARRNPAVSKKIAAAGHEIASHGTGHDRLHRLNPATFREDLLTSRKLLEDQTGQRVIGYRAPTFSVVAQTAWAIDVLSECGFAYDASIFPVTHPLYGVPAAPDRPFYVKPARGSATRLLEVPPLTWTAGGKKLAVAGGGYFRLLPLWFMKRGLAQAAKQGRPAILYFHPWEFDPGMPRMPLKFTGRLRTYTGLATAEAKLASIIRQPAAWMTMADAAPRFRAIADEQREFVLNAAS